MTIELVEQKFGLYGYLDMHKGIRRHANLMLTKARYTSVSDSESVKALQKEFNLYWGLVEEHHKTEDNGFFLMIAGIDNLFATQFQTLIEDHHVIDDIVLQIQTGLEGAVAGNKNAYESYVAALATFQHTMDDHLDREEALVIPAICRNISYEDQVTMEAQIISNMPAEHVAKMFPWMLQIMTPEERENTLKQLPQIFLAALPEWEAQYNKL